MKKIILIIAAAILISIPSVSTADEGMWMVNLIEKGLMSKMKKAGLRLPPNVIYDENAVSLSDAVVALDFGCTGSMISNNGLLITNHHCAYGDVHSISTPEHNYLEDGFWAMSMSEEVPIPGKGIYFLRKVIDISEEVDSLKAAEEAAGRNIGSRKLCFILEKKYSQEYGYEAMLSGMWRGEKHYMFLYDVYKDVRLVAAPPVSIAAYGGDTDNWEWPQHKGDFAMYRVYASVDGKPAEYSKDNVPLVPRNYLKISTAGVKKGDFTMILGFPGRTNRYNSSFGVNQIEKVINPITTKIRRHQLNIMDSWMVTDPAIRLKYADKYFSLSNVQELNEGEILTYRRYSVVALKEKEEIELQNWIDSYPEREEKWGTLLADMGKMYSGVEKLEKEMAYYRETFVRSTYLFTLSMKIKTLIRSCIDVRQPDSSVYTDKCKYDSLTASQKEIDILLKYADKIYAQIDTRVEKDLFFYSIKTFIENVGKEGWGESLISSLEQFHGNINDLLSFAWDNSYLTSKEKFDEFFSKSRTVEEIKNDPMLKILFSTSIYDFNHEIASVERRKGEDRGISFLEKQYTNALYEMKCDKGIVQYPDANSTMRLTYGNVGPINPSDGIYYSEVSTTEGILDKYNPDDYEFTLKPRQKELLEAKDWGRWGDKNGRMSVDFLSNNDITGGNSGSPVMNAKGELVGLAFDGNKESLCGDAYFHPEYSKCVNVDIRYVLYILDKYAGMNYILEELGLKNGKN
jgi:hypothetical protein